MASKSYRSAESATPVASHAQMREYPKTGIVHQDIKLYIEGVQVPFIAISISESYKGYPSATIQIPYFAGLTEITKNYTPKVHVFFRDYVYEKYLIQKGVTDYKEADLYRVLFEGILLTNSYSRTKASDSGSATIQFSCVHKYWFLNQVLLKFGGRGNDVSVGNLPEPTTVSNYMSSPAAILDALGGIENTSERSVNPKITSVDDINMRALPPDLLPYFDRLKGVTGISVVLWNTLKRDSYVYSNYSKTMTEMYIPLIDEGLKFFKKMTGHPLIESGMETEKIPVSVSTLASRINKLAPVSDVTKILAPANYRNFINDAVAIEVAVSLMSVGNQAASGETTSLVAMISSLLEGMIYDLQLLASPVQSKDPNLESINAVVKPLLPFYFSPTCNVLFPHMYTSISVQDGANLSPTRLVAFPDGFTGPTRDKANQQEFRAPHEVRLAAALNHPLGNLTLNGTTIRHGEFPAPHEFSRGMLVKEVQVKPWIKNLYAAYRVATEERAQSEASTSANASGSSPQADSLPILSLDPNPNAPNSNSTRKGRTLNYGVATTIDVARSEKEYRAEAIWKHWNIRENPIPFYYGSITKKGTNVVYGKNGVATPGSPESATIENFRSTTKVPIFWNVVLFPYNNALYAYPPHFDYIRRQWFAVDEIPAPLRAKYVFTGQEANSSQSSGLTPLNPKPPTTISLVNPLSRANLSHYISEVDKMIAARDAAAAAEKETTDAYWEDPLLNDLKIQWDKEHPNQESLNPFATKEVNGSPPHETTLINTLDYEYSLSLVENKQGSVEGLFNPYIVVGYPMDIIDPSPERPSYHAFCLSKTHSITPRSISTSITFSSALTYDELRAYELPSILPWYRKQLDFTKKQSLINQTAEAKSAANSFYSGVFGCGYADPTILENDQTNSVNFVKVNARGDFEVTLSKANLSEQMGKDSMILGFTDQNLSYEGNLAMVRREIETLSDIERLDGIRFIDISPSSESTFSEAAGEIKVSALRPEEYLKPGRSAFLSYRKLDTVVWDKIKAKFTKVKSGGTNGDS